MYKIALILITCSGCLDDFTYGIQVETTELQPNQVAAEELLIGEVSLAYGWDLADIDIVVHWTTTTCPGTTTPAVVWDGQCFGGLTFSCDHIYVPIKSNLTEGSLLHELGHCVRLHAGHDGDRLHVDEKFWQFLHFNVREKWFENGW